MTKLSSLRLVNDEGRERGSKNERKQRLYASKRLILLGENRQQRHHGNTAHEKKLKVIQLANQSQVGHP